MKRILESVPWWSTHLGEEEAEAAAAAVRARNVSRGPLTEELELRIAAEVGVGGAFCVPSGSLGLVAALMALGIGPGDEVIVPDFTWIATAHAAAVLGARAVLVDCLPGRPLIDPAAVAAAISPRTRAIVPVHLAGRVADMAALLRIADAAGVSVVEDAAQAFQSCSPLGPAGAVGRVGVYSLGLAKLVSTGQGGVVVSDDEELLGRLFDSLFHGVPKAPEETYLHLGLNLKFTDVQAAIGLAQMDRLEDKRRHVRAVYERYADGLADVGGIDVEPLDLERGELPLWTEIRCESRDALRTRLAEQGIETRLPHRPLHHAAHLFSGDAEDGGDGRPDGDARFPNATRHARELLVLPSGPSQRLEDVDRVIDSVREVSWTL